jgi:hypothetical protein
MLYRRLLMAIVSCVAGLVLGPTQLERAAVATGTVVSQRATVFRILNAEATTIIADRMSVPLTGRHRGTTAIAVESLGSVT